MVSQPKLPGIAILRQSPPLRAGQQAIAYGFPLSGALASEGNLTIGNVSALRGLGDDPNYIQITTPVQPGNSGGPLLDSSGNVIGVVAAKLDALKIMRAIGDVPQNVNFAIELGILKRFLQKHGVRTKEALSRDELSPADIGDRAKFFTYLIECETTRPRQAETSSPQPPSSRSDSAPSPSEPPRPIPLDISKLKWSDIRRPYPTLSPETFELDISNAGSDRVTELIIGFTLTEGQQCSSKLESYDGFKRFPVDLSPGDSVTLINKFSAQAQAFCIIRAMGPPEGRSACANANVLPDVAIAACTRSIMSGEVREISLATDYNNRGWWYSAKGDLNRAIADYTEVIKFDPDSARAHNNRARAYEKKGDYTLALQDYVEVSRLEPTNAPVWNSRCWTRAIIGQELQKALADCEEALRIRPDEASSIDSRGLTFLKLGRLDDRYRRFRRGAKTLPEIRGLALLPRHCEEEKRRCGGF